MAESVYILGAGRTDFGRNLRKEGRTLGDVIVEAGRAAVFDAGIAPGEIGAGVVGNFAGGLFTRQLHLGAFLTEIDEAMRGLPTMHVEAACASGSVAVLAAAHQIMAGIRDVVLVVGAEQQKTMPPAEGADVLGAAAQYADEREEYGEFLFPKLFARIAEVYAERYGLSQAKLASVAIKNRRHALLNPLAQMRDKPLVDEVAATASEANPMIAAPLKASDCSQITDGAAALVLGSESFFQKIGRRRGARLLGFGHTTDHLLLAGKDAPTFSIAASAAARAYAMAGVAPQDLHGVELHDCFSISEIVQYEVLGLAAPGKGAELLESGATALPGGRCPVNAGGGLLGDGHPVGATGVRQVVEAFQQLTGQAGARQIPGAKRFLTCNIGGTMTTTVVMIWESV